MVGVSCALCYHAESKTKLRFRRGCKEVGKSQIRSDYTYCVEGQGVSYSLREVLESWRRVEEQRGHLVATMDQRSYETNPWNRTNDTEVWVFGLGENPCIALYYHQLHSSCFRLLNTAAGGWILIEALLAPHANQRLALHSPTPFHTPT